MMSLAERAGDKDEPLRRLFDSIMSSLRVAVPGIIESFDPDTQTATVRVAVREKVLNEGVTEDVEIPILPDVLVSMPRAGGFVLAVPVKKGDECLVVFGDTCIDSWFQSGGVQDQMDRRRHDLSDAIAIVGLWSQPRALVDFPTDAAQLRTDSGNTMVEVKNGTINVLAGSVNLSNAGSLHKLIDERIAAAWADGHTHTDTTPAGVTGPPVVGLTAQLANCTTTKTKGG